VQGNTDRTVVDISVVVPAYNEAEVLPKLVAALCEVLSTLTASFEIVLVNDGSTDSTEQMLQELRTAYPAVVAVNLARNFGKEPALAAGLASARGRCVAFMDADLQHPPSVIRLLYEGWMQGYDVVNAVKRERTSESLVHRAFAHLFNRIMSASIGRDMAGASDFKLIDRQVADVLLECQERNRFFRGLVAWVGFKVKSVEFDVPVREHGQSKWSVRALARYFLNNVVAFSSLPLRLVAYAGFALATLGLALLIQTLYHFWIGTAAIGFTTVIALQILIGGMILAALGVIAIYLSKMYDEQKQRPLFIVRSSRPRERSVRPGIEGQEKRE
jgi:glycosyltransferase involved in cell wall biosynthesis